MEDDAGDVENQYYKAKCASSFRGWLFAVQSLTV
jgi:hypothetical protein